MWGLAVLLGRSLPCPDFYLGATVSTAVAVPPDGELTERQFKHLRPMQDFGFLLVLHRIPILVIQPVMGGDLVEVCAVLAHLNGVSPHERSVSPPETTVGVGLKVVNREGRHDGRSIYLLSFRDYILPHLRHNVNYFLKFFQKIFVQTNPAGRLSCYPHESPFVGEFSTVKLDLYLLTVQGDIPCHIEGNGVFHPCFTRQRFSDNPFKPLTLVVLV